MSGVTSTWWDLATSDHAERAFRGLVCRLDEGNPLPVIDYEFGGSADEALHVDVPAYGWRYGGMDVSYEHREFVDFGGLGIMALTIAASVVGNRRRREAAWAAARPQWRPLGCGPIRVQLTDQRVVLDAEGQPISLWFPRGQGLDITYDLASGRLELYPAGGSPFALEGPWMPYLTAALAYALRGEILVLQPSASSAS